MDGGLHENLPYWMNGAVPLAVQLGDTKLFSTIEGFLDIIFKLQQTAGWIGPDTESLATIFLQVRIPQGFFCFGMFFLDTV